MLSNLTCDLLRDLEGADSPDSVWLNASGYLESFGLTHSIYSFVDPGNPAKSSVWTSLPKSWCERYKDREYHLKDPFYRYCCRTFRAFLAGAAYLDRYPYLGEAERRIILEGSEAGFRSGFTAPVRLCGSGAFGGWNFGSAMRPAEIEQLFKSHGAEIRFAAFCIHECAQNLARESDRPKETHRLSPRERECLLWLSRGYRTSAIAHRLGIADVTVDMHFKGARRKLRAATREEALAKAILAGELAV